MTKLPRNPLPIRISKLKYCSSKRLLYAFIWLLIFAIMTYRIADWGNQYFGTDQDPVNLVGQIKWSRPLVKPYLLLCNVNPIRGTRIFLMSNGSKIYDIISDSITDVQGYQKGIHKILKQSMIDRKMLFECSHKIKDMLKECRINTMRCSENAFESVWYNSRVCHRFYINNSVSKISWTLDPEEYDYIIPNNGFVGFRLMLADSLLKEIPIYDTIMAGPFYQTNVKIKLIKNLTTANNNYCKEDSHAFNSIECKRVLFTNSTSSDHQIQYIVSQIYISSQYYKSPFFSTLLTPKSLKSVMRNSDILRKANLVQQRAYLRYTDKSLFYEFEQLTSVFRNLFQSMEQLHKHLIHLNISVNSDHRYISHLPIRQSKCGLNFVSILKILQQMIKQYQNFQSEFPIMRHFTYVNQYQPTLNELSILNMIFGDEFLPQMEIRHSLQQQLNTIVSVKFQLKDSTQYDNCQLEMIDNLQNNYLQHLEEINSVISNSIDTLKTGKDQLLILRNSTSYIRSVFTTTRSKELMKISMMSLVTIDIEVISQPFTESLRQTNNPFSKYHRIAEILGIICGTLGGSVPLLMLLEWCYRYKRKPEPNATLNQPKTKTRVLQSISTEHIELSSDLDSIHPVDRRLNQNQFESNSDSQRAVVFVF